jgi:hypothetical protein
MEFDSNSPVNDEARRLAESKKLTLQPVHTDVAPEEIEGETVARHLAGPAIANVSNDIEQDTASIQPSEGILQQSDASAVKTRHFSFLFAALLVIILTILGTTIYFIV